jgi:hypothetical protein
MADESSNDLEMLMVPPGDKRNSNRSSRCCSSFHTKSHWLLCVAAGLLIVLVLLFAASPNHYVHSHVKEFPNDEGTVWIGGYAMMIDPKVLTVVAHENGAVSILETNSNKRNDHMESVADVDENDRVASERLV